MKAEDYLKKEKRLQNFKKCLGCGEIYELGKVMSRCPACKNKKFIDVTEYIYEYE